MTTNNKLEPVPKGDNKLVGVNLGEELQELAMWAVQSKMFPDITTVSQGGMKILAGRELAVPAVSSLTAFHFIKGRVVHSADLLAALIKRSGKYNYKILEHSDTKCTVEFWEFFNNSWQTMGVPVTYTMEDAKREGSDGKETYKKFTDDMFFAACMRKGVRRYCADITKGSEFMGMSEGEFVGAELESQVSDFVGEVVEETETTEPEAVEAEFEDVPAEESTTRDETVNAICKDLNDAGDSIQWAPKSLIEYANELLDTKFATLKGLSDEQFDKLCLDLNERLETLKTADPV